MKIVMLSDVNTHFMCYTLPYLGKGTIPLPKKNLGDYFVMELTKPFLCRGRCVTMDNWFSSLPGTMALRERGLEFAGTIRVKPYLPKEILTMKMEVGETVSLYNYKKKIMLVCHKARKTKRVQLLSTVHHNPTVIEKKKTDRQVFYNATKEGVDTFDQLCASASCSCKTLHWSLSFFYGIMNLVCINSYILC